MALVLFPKNDIPQENSDKQKARPRHNNAYIRNRNMISIHLETDNIKLVYEAITSCIFTIYLVY